LNYNGNGIPSPNPIAAYALAENLAPSSIAHPFAPNPARPVEIGALAKNICKFA
jgi:hypothetical protein